MLGELRDEYAILVPCLRGHVLRLADLERRAGGDRRDSWDGATDDVVAALDAVGALYPALREAPVVAFGASRGGSVALLAGARSARIDAVVAFAPPMDWFDLMSRPSEPLRRSVERAWSEGMRIPAPDRDAQFIEWFLQDRHDLPLSALRARMIASSPLYFLDRLPAVSIDQGADDESVPVANAHAAAERLSRLAGGVHERVVRIHAGAGHRLDDTAAIEKASAFLARFTRRRR